MTTPDREVYLSSSLGMVLPSRLTVCALVDSKIGDGVEFPSLREERDSSEREVRSGRLKKRERIARMSRTGTV